MKKDTNSNRESGAKSQDSDCIAQGVRRKYLYRKMVIEGKAKMPARLAMKMVGPDCAFHLYRSHSAGDTQESKSKSQ